MGVALSPLREQDVLLVGSGMSFHNMGEFRRQPGSAGRLGGQVSGAALCHRITRVLT